MRYLALLCHPVAAAYLSSPSSAVSRRADDSNTADAIIRQNSTNLAAGVGVGIPAAAAILGALWWFRRRRRRTTTTTADEVEVEVVVEVDMEEGIQRAQQQEKEEEGEEKTELPSQQRPAELSLSPPARVSEMDGGGGGVKGRPPAYPGAAGARGASLSLLSSGSPPPRRELSGEGRGLSGAQELPA